MIKKINIPETTMLHKSFGDSITFTDGINVIYGGNGTGKSLLLKTIAYNVFINKKGWTEPLTNHLDEENFQIKTFDIKKYLNQEYVNPYLIDETKKLYAECTVEWDGVAAFKGDSIPTKEIMKWDVLQQTLGTPRQSEVSLDEMKNICKEQLSSGQTANRFIENFLKMEVPDLAINESQKQYYIIDNKETFIYKNIKPEELLSNYVVTLPRDGKPTLLLDEIDGFFDFDNLYTFWTESIIELAKKYQIIIVTHNPFFLTDDMNIINKEYFDKSMNLLKLRINKIIGNG